MPLEIRFISIFQVQRPSYPQPRFRDATRPDLGGGRQFVDKSYGLHNPKADSQLVWFTCER